ncbi:MAG: hypothetical protein ACI3XE_00705 [Eubacteriales bacterium]
MVKWEYSRPSSGTPHASVFGHVTEGDTPARSYGMARGGRL